ncbi:MAG TPA: Mrp/NBP35 family ATP-binding protein [Planctomycetota bacterium]|nr:Mrp/NBP35 family ATP-binding protein [Planctomycetota bacterium]
MAEITSERVLQALEGVKDPDLGSSIVAMGMIKDLKIDGTKLTFTCELTTPACPVKEQIEKDIRAKIAENLPEVSELNLTMTGKVRGANIPTNDDAEVLIPQIKNVVLVGGGKGGTGKSTLALNLAVALQKLGASVALLDANIYGPSLPILTGIREKPKLAGESKIKPLSAFGLEVMSMGFLVDSAQAMMWRGPVVNGIVVQFLRDVTWGENDYLIVDLPPGVGEVQLSIAQNCAVTGAVLVTTPQYVSIADVVRAKAMFDQTRIAVLGLIENMSAARDSGGNRLAPFSEGGGERAANEMSVPFLGKIPLSQALSESADYGIPLVYAQPELEVSKAIVAAAEKLAAQVSIRNLTRESARPLSESVAG